MILDLANEQDPVLEDLGGGAEEIEVKEIETRSEAMLIVHIVIDTRDAMGANAVNTMAEAVAPLIEEITGGKVLLRILTNLADKRLAKARATFDKESLGDEESVDRIMDAYEFARSDPYRCATHNKGVMNGIEAVALATGNDTRALEAGAHSYATLNGGYEPFTKWEKNENGDLVGEIEIPVGCGDYRRIHSSESRGSGLPKDIGGGFLQGAGRGYGCCGSCSELSGVESSCKRGDSGGPYASTREEHRFLYGG